MKKLRSTWLVAFHLTALSVLGQSPPYLQFNAGGHTSPIGSISFNAERTVALTVSNDKTARVWNSRTGEMLRTLRPPISDGEEGQLHAGALHPSGSVAVVGGLSQGENRGTAINVRLHVFDAATGHLLWVIPGLPNAISKISFSQSGRYFAVGLGGPNGIYVFDSATMRRVGRDADYQDGCHGLAWHGDDRLAATSYDGQARLYTFGPDGLHRTHARLVGEESTRSELENFATKLEALFVGAKRNQPEGIQFSPDGSKVAIGFYSSPLVEIRSAYDLNFITRPDLRGLPGTPKNKGNLMNVAWSTDGRSLIAGGNYRSPSSGRQIVRRWDSNGAILDREVPVSGESIRSLCPVSDSEFAFAAADPCWGTLRFDGAPQVRLFQTSPTADFSQGARRFRVSQDGNTVAFGYEEAGTAPAQFSVRERHLLSSPGLGAGAVELFPPRITAPGLNIHNWEDTDGPTLGKMKLLTKDNEVSRSLAISSDSSSFVLGTGWAVYHMDSRGNELWRTPAHNAWCVNLAQNDEIVVVAAADGTIRWLEAATGKELLGFFPHSDRRRWVLWAPVVHRQSFPVVDLGRCSSDVSRVLTHTNYDRLVAVNNIPVKGTGYRETDEVCDQIIKRSQPGDHMVLTFLAGGRHIDRHVELQPITHWRTTEVYYDCSAGGEDLLGWHINRRPNESADFFPISRFRALYHRPDVISRVLALRSVEAALREANRAMGKTQDTPKLAQVLTHLSPPVVDIHSGDIFNLAELPAEASHMPLRYSVRQTGQEKVTHVEVRLNGRLLLDDMPVPEPGRMAEVQVPLPMQHENRLSVVARSEHTSSEPRNLTVRRVGVLPAAALPDLYLLSVGVSESKTDASKNLQGAYADAQNLAEALRRGHDSSPFQNFHPEILTGPRATLSAVIQAIKDVAARSRHGDLLVLSMSSHGFVDRSGFHMEMFDSDTTRADAATLSDSRLLAELRHVKANVLLLLGSCHSGAAFGNSAQPRSVLSPAELTGLVNHMGSSEHGIAILSAVDNREMAYETDAGSFFMQVVLEGLSGAAAINGEITCKGLQDYVVRQLPATARAAQIEQSPQAVFPGEMKDMVLTVPAGR